MPNESYDVFVSYAHADNEIPQNATLDIGWVAALAANLNTGPNVRKKKLFIDHQLKPGDEFSDDLITKVRNSRLLILLLSQNYIDSKWCGKEVNPSFDKIVALSQGRETSKRTLKRSK